MLFCFPITIFLPVTIPLEVLAIIEAGLKVNMAMYYSIYYTMAESSSHQFPCDMWPFICRKTKSHEWPMCGLGSCKDSHLTPFLYPVVWLPTTAVWEIYKEVIMLPNKSKLRAREGEAAYIHRV